MIVQLKFPPVILLGLMILGVRSAHALDLNGDGMSDVWQRVYNIANGDTASDPDGDGQNNGKEAEAGTNPHDANDYFRTFNFSVNPTLGEVSLTWRSVEYRYYEIEQSTDLVSWEYASYGYGEFDQTTTSTTFSPYPPGQTKIFFRVRGYPEYDYDDDGDGLQSWEERLLGTDPYDYDGDTDNDGMDDRFEFIYQFDPLSAADGSLDSDGDLLTNAVESRLGLNPRVSDTDGNGISDANEDSDLDGLTNIQEILTYGTDPSQPDTDGDGLSDGWEITYGFSALINNDTDENPNNDSSADPDGDGLDNGAEDQIGTNPNNSDTDGDGFSDFVEDQAGSNANGGGSTPGNPGGTPGGPASPPPPIISVQVNFGDHSGSHSEKYKVILEPQSGDANTQKRYRTNRKYGQTQTETFNLPAGAKYKITFVHVGTDPQYTGTPKPDYDYTLKFTSGSTDATIASIPEDPAGMLGVHDESEAFFASGKNASLYIAWLKSETVASIPADRKRTKLGVGEEVDLNVTPLINGITWTASVGKLDQTSGPNSKLSLADTTGAASVTVNYLGKTLTKNFTVFAPTGVVSSSVASTESYPVGTQGAGMHLYPVVVGPTDVSFYNVQMLEVGRAASSITGYFLNNTPISHVGHGADEWFPLDYANQWPSSWDYANLYGYPAPWTPGGSFTWIIPAKWKVGNTGTEHTITGWDQVFEIQSNGTTTIRKFGHSVTRTINDISTSN